MQQRAVLFVNSNSRHGKAWFDEACTQLKAKGVHLEKAILTKSVAEMRSEVEASTKASVPLIICGGGDGTFNSIARYLAGSASVLGVLPLGTGNAFARDLGIETSVESACEVIAKGVVADVDLGTVNEVHFLNVVSLGLSTLIAKNLTKETKRFLGPVAYILALALALRSVKPFRVTITTEGRAVEFSTMQLVIGNGRFHAGPFLVAPDAGIQTGELSIYALKSSSKAGFLGLAAGLARGMDCDPALIYAVSAREGSVVTTPPVTATADGESIGLTPITFSIAPGALKVMTPEPTEGQHLEPSSQQD